MGPIRCPKPNSIALQMKLEIGYPDRASQLAILNQVDSQLQDATNVGESLSLAALQQLQSHVQGIRVSTVVQEYLVELCEATRRHESVALGLSPRGMLIWQRVARAWALLQNRDFVIPDDIQAVANPVVGVRLITRGQPVSDVIESILKGVEAPSYR